MSHTFKILYYCLLFSLLLPFKLTAQGIRIPNNCQKIECEIVPLNSYLNGHSSSGTTKEAAKEMGKNTSKARTKSLHSFQQSMLNSSNWCGYVAYTSSANPESSINYIQGLWTVPEIPISPYTTYSACGIGMDGYFNSTMEQIGSAAICSAGQTQYYAWLRMAPPNILIINGFPINPHDVIAAGITYQGNDVFELIILNVTQSVYYIVPSSYTTSSNAYRNSAEWIVLNFPYNSGDSSVLGPLAHFTPISFSDCIVQFNNTTSKINNHYWECSRLTMVNPQTRRMKASASPLSTNGKNFTVTWFHK